MKNKVQEDLWLLEYRTFCLTAKTVQAPQSLSIKSTGGP